MTEFLMMIFPAIVLTIGFTYIAMKHGTAKKSKIKLN